MAHGIFQVDLRYNGLCMEFCRDIVEAVKTLMRKMPSLGIRARNMLGVRVNMSGGFEPFNFIATKGLRVYVEKPWAY